MKPNHRNFALWIIIILLVVALVMLFVSPGKRVPSQDVAFSQLLNEVDQGHIREVTIAGNEITGHYADDRAFATYAPNDPSLVQSLYKKNVAITAKPPSESTNWLMTLLVNGVPLIAIIGVWIWTIFSDPRSHRAAILFRTTRFQAKSEFSHGCAGRPARRSGASPLR